MKFIISTFIILFLLVQSYFPIRYYFKLNQLKQKEGYQSTIVSSSVTGEEPELINFEELEFNTDDERFVWRMFSPTAIDTKCTFEYYNSVSFKKINHQSQYFKQWIDLMEMCRKPVIEEISKDICKKNQNQVILIKEILSNKFDYGKKIKSNMLEKFIFEFKFELWKLKFFKFLFFFMYSIDCWLEIPRASNYWTIERQNGSFINISHFGIEFDNYIKELFGINSLITHDSFLFSMILSGFISLRCAFNLNIQIFEPLLLALLKGYVVLSSQADNYQHHYLLILVLAIVSTINWNQFKGVSNKSLVSCWQAKLLLIQVSIVYIWTSIAKFHWSWINGEVLPRMVGPEFKDAFNHYFEMLTNLLGIDYIQYSSMSLLSCLTIISELFLAISLHIPSLSILTFLIGTSMHIFMGSFGLRIGTFSYFMVIIYILSLPNYFKRFNNNNNQNNNDSNSNNKNNNSSKNSNNSSSSKIGLIILDTLKILFIGLTIIICLLYNLIDPLFMLYFVFPLTTVLIIIIVQNILYNSSNNNNSNNYNLKKQFIYLATIIFLVSALIQTSDQFRLLYIDRGAMAIGLNSLDDSINSYSIAEEIADRIESKVFRINHYRSSDFEFIGDLGLFLETKSNYSKAIILYEKYGRLYPDILKIQIGIIRSYHGLEDLNYSEKKSKICSLIPNVRKASSKFIEVKCISQDCARNQNHAKYVLSLTKQLNDQYYC